MGEARGDQPIYPSANGEGLTIPKKADSSAPLVISAESLIRPRATHAQYIQRRNEQIEAVRQDIKKVNILDENSQPGWIQAHREGFEKLLTREGYPKMSVPLFLARRSTVKKLEQAGIANAENTVRLLEGTLLFQDRHKDTPAIVNHLKKLYVDLQKGQGIRSLAEIPDCILTIEKLYALGFDTYDLPVDVLLSPQAKYRELFIQVGQLDTEHFYRNIGQLEPYAFLFDNFNIRVTHGNAQQVTNSLELLDVLGASQISDELLTSIKTTEDAQKIRHASGLYFDTILDTCNPTTIIAGARRIEDKLHVVAAYLADHGLQHGDLSKLLETDPDAIPFAIDQLDDETLHRLSMLIKKGWRVSQIQECSDDLIVRAEQASENFSNPEKLARLSYFQDIRPSEMEELDFYRLGSAALMESIFAYETTTMVATIHELVKSTGEEDTDTHVGTYLRFDAARGIGANVALIDATLGELLRLRRLPPEQLQYWNFWNQLSEGGLLEYENMTRFLLGSREYVVSQLRDGNPSAELVNALKKRYTEAIKDLEYNEKNEKRNSFITYFLEDHVPPEFIGLRTFIDSYMKRNISISPFFTEALYGLNTWKGLCDEKGNPNPALYYGFMKAGRVGYIDSPYILSDERIATFPDRDQVFFRLYVSAPYDMKRQLAAHHELFVGQRADVQSRLGVLQEYAAALKRMPAPVQSELSSNTDLIRTLDAVFDEAELDEGKVVQLRKSLRILERIYSSPSKEIHRIGAPLLSLLLASDHPDTDFARIERIYIGNNLPNVIKEGLVFEQVFSQTDAEGKTLLEKTLDKPDDLVLLSPLLRQADIQERFRLFRGYMLANAIRSGDRNLREYLSSFQEAQRIIGYIDRYGFNAVPYETEITRFLNRAEALYGATYTTGAPDNQIPESDIQGRFNRLAISLGAHSYAEIPRRLKQVFLEPFGYTSIDEILRVMDEGTIQAHMRNTAFARSIAEGVPIFTQGDLLKSTQSHVARTVLKTGPKCAEALGAELESNNTPFDADFSRVALDDLVLPFDKILEAALTRTAMSEDNDILLLVKNRENFVDTTNGTTGFPADFSRYETFWSKYADIKYGKPDDPNKRHFGVLVGVAATDIDAIILTDAFVTSANYETKLSMLFFNIAHGGCPIPVIYRGKRVAPIEDLEYYKTPAREIDEFLSEYFEHSNVTDSQKIIGILTKNPLLAHLYHMPAGVQEHYTLEQHTKMVLDRFDRYWKDRFIALNLNAQEFALMLALHDIGKPIASSTQLQHDMTRPIIEDVLVDVDIPPLRKELIIEIASQDLIGQFLQGNQMFEKTVEGIRYIARITGVSVKEVYWLCKYYYQCDVGSYTKDADPAIEKGRFDDDIVFDQTNRTMRIVNEKWVEQLERLDKELLQ